MRPLVACPSCACHLRAGDRECPHCGAAVVVTGARAAPAAASVLLGLTASVTFVVGACSSRTVVPGASQGSGGATASPTGTMTASGTGGANTTGIGGAMNVGTGGTGPDGPVTATYMSAALSSYAAPVTGPGPSPCDVGDCNKCQQSACAQSFCQPEYDVCMADMECHALLDCTWQCKSNDVSCTDACVKQHPNGAMAYSPLLKCYACSPGPCHGDCLADCSKP